MDNKPQIKLFDYLLQDILETMRIDRPETWSEYLENYQIIDLHLLTIVANQPDIILKEIRERLDIPNSTLTSVIDRLEKRGLLHRLISQRDKRSYGLKLTDVGSKVQAEHDRVHHLIAAQLMDALEAGEQQLLIDLLAKIQVKIKGG